MLYLEYQLHTLSWSSIVFGRVHPPPEQASSALKKAASISSSITSSFTKVLFGFFDIRLFLKPFYNKYKNMSNQVKLEIHLFVMNFNSRVFFSKSTVLCGGYWLWAWQVSGDCRPALLEGLKYQMVKIQTESHNMRPIV